MAHSTGRVRGTRRTRGETLVETIVAFAVLMILLSLVTTIVRAGISLNNRAIETTARLNADCTDIELGSGLTGMGNATLTLQFIKGGTGALQIPLDLMQGGEGLLYSFKSREVIGGGG